MKKQTSAKMVKVHVARLPGVEDERQVIRVGHNFKNYCIRRGEDVMVPVGVANRIEQHIKAQETADRESMRLKKLYDAG